MKRPILPISALLAVMVLLDGTIMAGEVRRVRAVEFRGLKLLSKYEIIRGVRMKAGREGIVIDMDSFRLALSKNHFIKAYEIGGNDSGLIISVTEKIPAYILAVVMGEKTNLYELDADYRVISKNDVHASNLPIVYITGQDVKIDAIQGTVKRLLALLGRVKKSDASIYREISEIYFYKDRLKITLRGRRTDFILRPDENDFRKLRYITGYLDRSDTSPGEITISDRAAIIR